MPPRAVLHASMLFFLFFCCRILRAQGDFAVTDSNVPPPKPLPAGVILVPGAIPSASDPRTPLPESGAVSRDVYRNAYFGLTYPLPQDWMEFKGPPPSDTGLYVLAQIVPSKSFQGSMGSILITAQDLFFSINPARDAGEMIRYSSNHLPDYYKVERPPVELPIAGHRFVRFDYMSPVAELHWYVFATQIRCHALQFVFTSRDTKLLDTLTEGLNRLVLPPLPPDAPACLPDYAVPQKILYKIDPVVADRKFNTIPVRIIIGKTGKVEHVHILSAFADQARTITDALLQWKFKPYTVDGESVPLETGLVFGTPRRRPGQQSLTGIE